MDSRPDAESGERRIEDLGTNARLPDIPSCAADERIAAPDTAPEVRGLLENTTPVFPILLDIPTPIGA